jgi:glycosyltransferase involved in cell wall biosynthesis
MSTLADWHHGGLYYSLVRLFEDRLGWKLYRPIGLEWAEQGYWQYSKNPFVIHQYLDIPNGFESKEGIYEMPWSEGEQKFTMRGITLEGFKKMDWRFVIASVVNHEEPFARLIREHAPEAVMIRQMGNIHDRFEPATKNILNSTNMPVPEGINTVRYHQEFSLEDYRPQEAGTKTVKSFLHAFSTPEPPQLAADYALWRAMEKALPEFTFKEHGVLCRDGNLPSAQIPGAMRSASFVCHLKFWGDGFGHSGHCAAACAKPLITKGKYFKGMMLGDLLEDEVTFLDIGDDVAKNAEKIRYWSEPARYAEMSKNMRERFLKVVDFDREFVEIKAFLDRALNIISI